MSACWGRPGDRFGKGTTPRDPSSTTWRTSRCASILDPLVYSWSTDVCARLVEVLSGQRFDDYVRATIFEPLGMVDTGFRVPDDQIDRFAACYKRDADKRLVLQDDHSRAGTGGSRRFLPGGGGLVSTTTDYLRFCLMLLAAASPTACASPWDARRSSSWAANPPGGGELSAFALPGATARSGSPVWGSA